MTHRPQPQADGYPGIDVTGTVTALVCQQLGTEPEEVLPGLALTDDMGADSLDLVSLAMALEEEFELAPIELSVLDELRTVADVVAFVERQLAPAGAPDQITS